MAGKLIAGGGLVLAASGLALVAAQPPSAPAPAPSSVPVAKPAAMLGSGGYLPAGAAPDSNTLIPPPPAPDSAANARDVAAMRAALALRGSPRWDQATTDALLFTPDATGVFSCAAGFRIAADATPKLNALLRKAGPDLALAVYPSKRK